VFHIIYLLGKVEEHRPECEPHYLETDPDPETDVGLLGQDGISGKEGAHANDSA
jgi:hypothetical protein